MALELLKAITVAAATLLLLGLAACGIRPSVGPSTARPVREFGEKSVTVTAPPGSYFDLDRAQRLEFVRKTRLRLSCTCCDE